MFAGIERQSRSAETRIHQVHIILVLRAEHDGIASGLLQERRQHASIGVLQALRAQLGHGLTHADAIENLPEDDFIEREEQHYTRARGQVTARELVFRVETMRQMVLMMLMVTQRRLPE